jgi:glycosyltransferase involved in cell wall biosynthesis
VRWVALVESPEHVCCRYRLAAFRPFLAAHGHGFDIRALPPKWWLRLMVYPELNGREVILQRKLLPTWEINLLRRQAARLVFDFDDAVFLRDSFAARGPHDTRRQRRFAVTLGACDAVVAGNAFLAEAVRRHSDGVRIHVIPTCVDPDSYVPATESPRRDGAELVWIGSSSTLQGLEKITPLLEELGQVLPGLRLRVICDRFPHLDHLRVVRCPWSAATEASDLAQADIGISWIPDDQWSRGKCGLKVLQYMAAGLPVVANPVGVHPEMIRHGETGFLAANRDQWLWAIRTLVADGELRRRMGSAGRRRVEAMYSIAAGGQAWLDVLGPLVKHQSRAV